MIYFTNVGYVLVLEKIITPKTKELSLSIGVTLVLFISMLSWFVSALTCFISVIILSSDLSTEL
jgi:uncharacterized membrane protein